jgi:hypothetical protein
MTILKAMKLLNFKLSIYLVTALLLCLSACEREIYTSWNCDNSEGDKLPMILKNAQMQLQGSWLNYCGSLGEKTYFDSTCPAAIEKSKITFIPSSGTLLDQEKRLHCKVL